jgi:hypothetical protein
MTRQGHNQKKAQLANGREPLECKAGHDEAKEESYFQATSNHHRCHDTQVPREWCNDRGAWIAVGKNQFVKGT